MNTNRFGLLFRLVLGLALIAQLAFGTVQSANAAGIWTVTGSLATGRGFHTATLLPDGKVLVAGGFLNNWTLAKNGQQVEHGKPPE